MLSGMRQRAFYSPAQSQASSPRTSYTAAAPKADTTHFGQIQTDLDQNELSTLFNQAVQNKLSSANRGKLLHFLRNPRNANVIQAALQQVFFTHLQVAPQAVSFPILSESAKLALAADSKRILKMEETGDIDFTQQRFGNVIPALMPLLVAASVPHLLLNINNPEIQGRALLYILRNTLLEPSSFPGTEIIANLATGNQVALAIELLQAWDQTTQGDYDAAPLQTAVETIIKQGGQPAIKLLKHSHYLQNQAIWKTIVQSLLGSTALGVGMGELFATFIRTRPNQAERPSAINATSKTVSDDVLQVRRPDYAALLKKAASVMGWHTRYSEATLQQAAEDLKLSATDQAEILAAFAKTRAERAESEAARGNS